MIANLSTLGKRIETIRDSYKMTQETFAEVFGVHENIVSEWENEHRYPTPSELKEIASVGGISVNRLLTGEGEEPWQAN